ncbi:MAG: SUMF1/EgtB/PvdO family nonheme iron enzyme [Polyangiaceae bacterium]
MASALAALVTAACQSEREVRPQLFVEVDTDMPTLSQVIEDDRLSRDAALDTLRIDVIDTSGHVIDFLDVVGPTPSDWPVSFGVPRAEGQAAVRLRLRLFRGQFADPGEANGLPTLEPLSNTTIDRVVDLTFPESGVRSARIELRGDCLGVRASFGRDTKSCVDADHQFEEPAFPTDPATGETRVGTWSKAFEQPCTGPSPGPDTICIPGGFAVLGERDFAGLGGGFLDPYPLVPVLISPFWMDRTEITVGRYRDFVNRNGEPIHPPETYLPGDRFQSTCSFLGLDSAANDQSPLNCMRRSVAEAICADAGGELPSEAQWEFAARGRGRGYLYPWGNEPADCCTASFERFSYAGSLVRCEAKPPLERVGSHPESSECNSRGDVSRDGVLDMAGSVAEMSRDSGRTFADDCWKSNGTLRDPVCEADGGLFTLRGGNFSAGQGLLLAALRNTSPEFAATSTTGARCVYRETKP